jgi:hypothetical protein
MSSSLWSSPDSGDFGLTAVLPEGTIDLSRREGWLVADDGVLRLLDGVVPTPSGWSWPLWAFDTALELVCELVIG